MKRFELLLATLLLVGAKSWAAFEASQSSARSAAMGNTFLLASDESATVFTNPAGLAAIPSAEMSFLYTKPFAGATGVNLSQGNASAALPSRLGGWGVGFAVFQAPGLMKEQTAVLGWGKTFRGVQAGAALKYLSHSFPIDMDPAAAAVFKNGTSKSAATADFGVVAPMGKILKLGLAVRNVTEPDLGLLETDKLQREIQMGGAVELRGVGLRVDGNLAVQRDPEKSGSRSAPLLGVEKLVGEKLALRAGADADNYTGGLGLRVGSFGFDYALILNRRLASETVTSHKVGFAYRFGQPVATPAVKEIDAAPSEDLEAVEEVQEWPDPVIPSGKSKKSSAPSKKSAPGARNSSNSYETPSEEPLEEVQEWPDPVIPSGNPKKALTPAKKSTPTAPKVAPSKGRSSKPVKRVEDDEDLGPKW